MTSRLDIGCILGARNDRHAGLKELAQKVLGVNLLKSKKISMSNWGLRNLSLEQIHYAARDAWVSAAVIDQLRKSNSDTFRVETIMEMEFMSSQRKMDDLDERAKLRRAAKLDLKDIIEGEGNNMIKGKAREERISALQKLMDKYRPDQPPSFGEDILNLSSLLEINN
jgi:ribonuclease D